MPSARGLLEHCSADEISFSFSSETAAAAVDTVLVLGHANARAAVWAVITEAVDLVTVDLVELEEAELVLLVTCGLTFGVFLVFFFLFLSLPAPSIGATATTVESSGRPTRVSWAFISLPAK